MRRWLWIAVLAGPWCVASGDLPATEANPHPTSRFVVSHPALATTKLSLGRSTKATLRGGDVHRYEFRLRAGQFAALEVAQTGGNVVAAVFDPDGRLIDLIDRNGQGFIETIDLKAAKSGGYAVQMAQFEWDTPSATYSISLARRERAGTTPTEIADQLLSSWYEPSRPGVAVAVLQGRRVVFERTIGMADVEQGTPIDSSTRFDLASVSKQFTAYGVAMLIDQGAIDPEASVAKYLPDVQLPAAIKIRHVLDHTSGLRDWDAAFGLIGLDIEDGITKAQIIEWVSRQTELNFPPGSAQAYSNTGYTLLAEVMARVTGASFGDWMAQNVFAPAGMSAIVNEEAHAALPKRAHSYAGALPPKLRSGSAMAAAGSSSMHASLADLVAWIRNGHSGKLANRNVLQLVGHPSHLDDGTPIDYGYGRWFGERKGLRYIGHLGLAAGFRVSFRQFPERDLSVVYMTNDGNDASYTRAEIIENLFLGIPADPIQVPDGEYVPPSAHRMAHLSDHQGIYFSDELRTAYEIRLHHEALVAFHGVNGAIPLIPEEVNRFRSDRWFMPSIEFTREGGESGFRISTEGARNMFFRKIGR